MRDNQASELKDFNNFIDTNLLIELPCVGTQYTWFNPNGKAMSRLDRVLMSEEWLLKWPICKQYVQSREVSDHCALVVKFMVKDWGPKSFRTLDVWFMEKGFFAMVKEKWISYPVQGNAFFMIKEKLKRLKGNLKVWNVFGNIETSKKMILQELEGLDRQACNGVVAANERLRRIGLLSRLKGSDKRMESLLCQKARASWLKNGDSCTKFYHSSLRWRRLRNDVKGVEVGGLWCEEPCTVRAEAKKLFENRFKATGDFGVRLDGVEFKSLTQEDNMSLVADFSEKEVREAVWHCEGSKSPDPMGSILISSRKVGSL
ncbi:uncharacterized protein [Phaseolus vulgaris]|uniref:uncharacterized protein n=1 Tax=Phaseolus vulgaris TaxID=3885 RepID=UPI0035CB4EAB